MLLVRETFEIVVVKKETLAKFFIEGCGERTDQRGVCVSPLWRGGRGKRGVTGETHLRVVVGEVETLAKNLEVRYHTVEKS